MILINIKIIIIFFIILFFFSSDLIIKFSSEPFEISLKFGRWRKSRNEKKFSLTDTFLIESLLFQITTIAPSSNHSCLSKATRRSWCITSPYYTELYELNLVLHAITLSIATIFSSFLASKWMNEVSRFKSEAKKKKYVWNSEIKTFHQFN